MSKAFQLITDKHIGIVNYCFTIIQYLLLLIRFKYMIIHLVKLLGIVKMTCQDIWEDYL